MNPIDNTNILLCVVLLVIVYFFYAGIYKIDEQYYMHNVDIEMLMTVIITYELLSITSILIVCFVKSLLYLDLELK